MVSIILSLERREEEKIKNRVYKKVSYACMHLSTVRYSSVSKSGERKFIQDVRQSELFLSYILALRV